MLKPLVVQETPDESVEQVRRSLNRYSTRLAALKREIRDVESRVTQIYEAASKQLTEPLTDQLTTLHVQQEEGNTLTAELIKHFSFFTESLHAVTSELTRLSTSFTEWYRQNMEVSQLEGLVLTKLLEKLQKE